MYKHVIIINMHLKDQKSWQIGIFITVLMLHGTKNVHKTWRRDLRPKSLGTTKPLDPTLQCFQKVWKHFYPFTHPPETKFILFLLILDYY